jgi:hypothetical protein
VLFEHLYNARVGSARLVNVLQLEVGVGGRQGVKHAAAGFLRLVLDLTYQVQPAERAYRHSTHFAVARAEITYDKRGDGDYRNAYQNEGQRKTVPAINSLENAITPGNPAHIGTLLFSASLVGDLMARQRTIL